MNLSPCTEMFSVDALLTTVPWVYQSLATREIEPAELCDESGDFMKTERLLRRVTSLIVTACDPEKIVLFGSSARGSTILIVI
jgi:hypothetical protein